MKLRRKQSTSRSAPATQTTLEAPETSAKPASKSAISTLTESAVIIALVTLVGSLYVLFFEAAYLKYFHFPYYFVSLNPSIVLGTSGLWGILLASLCGVAVVYILLNAFLIWLHERAMKKRGERGEIRESVTLNLLVSVVCIFFFIVGAYSVAKIFFEQGYEYAKSLEEFPVFELTSTNPDTTVRRTSVAVIRTYGEYL